MLRASQQQQQTQQQQANGSPPVYIQDSKTQAFLEWAKGAGVSFAGEAHDIACWTCKRSISAVIRAGNATAQWLNLPCNEHMYEEADVIIAPQQACALLHLVVFVA